MHCESALDFILNWLTYADYSPFRRWTCGRIINTLLQRYQTPNANCFHPLLCSRMNDPVGNCVERDTFGYQLLSTIFWWTVSNGRSCRRCIFSWRIIIFLCRCALLSLSADEETILNLFHPLFASWLYLCCSVLCSGAAVHTFNYLNVKITTLSNGYLGSRNDEERSEMRYVMRIAEFSESSNLWTQIALLGSPSSTPLSVSVQQSLSSVSACWLDNESPCALSCGLFKYIELWKPIPVLSLHLFSFGGG